MFVCADILTIHRPASVLVFPYPGKFHVLQYNPALTCYLLIFNPMGLLVFICMLSEGKMFHMIQSIQIETFLVLGSACSFKVYESVWMSCSTLYF